MGLLETRLLDFDNIILTNVNEGYCLKEIKLFLDPI